MTTPDQKSIDAFISITGSSQLVAIHKLTEHGGVLNEALNSYFTQTDANNIYSKHETNVAAPHEDSMDIDETHRRFRESHHLESASKIDYATNTLPEIVPETGVTDVDVAGGITHVSPSAPAITNLPDFGIQEEMIQAAIEASKREAETSRPDVPTDQEKVGPSETLASKSAEVEEVKTLALSNGRLGVGSSSVQEDADGKNLVRRRSRRLVNLSLQSSPAQQQIVNNPDEGGISSEEHNMLEAAMVGVVPQGARHRVPYTRSYYRRNSPGRINGPYTRLAPRSPSPTLIAQRLIREQQNDEYLASLQADREKELLEQAAREAAMEEEQRKLAQEQEIERQVAAKETSLPQEPASDAANAVNLLVRMPDGSRHGRRFMKTDKLQCLFDYIDAGRMVKPSTYRLVRPYPRCAFSDGESDLTFNELGLTSKHEALFLEFI